MIDAEALEILSTNEEQGQPHALMMKDEDPMFRASLLDLSCIGAFLSLQFAGPGTLFDYSYQTWLR